MDASYYKKYEPVFGTWKIKKLIGEGGFGKVFAIEREDFGQTYTAALKAITIPQSKSELNDSLSSGLSKADAKGYFEDVVKGLTAEISLMSKLKGNSNIVSYEDHMVVEHEEGIGWDILIRMELLTPLQKHMEAHPLQQNDILKLGIDLCRALELCQEHQIIHRDIKPANIFVSEHGDFKLGDFGIARTVEKTSGGLSRKGTLGYMAPEVYLGKPYGPSVDLYSLGLVLYVLLNNGRMPFLPPPPEAITYSAQEQAMARRVQGEVLPAPRSASKRLAEIILKACAHDPARRYRTPTEMRAALEDFLTRTRRTKEFPAQPPAPPSKTEPEWVASGTELPRKPSQPVWLIPVALGGALLVGTIAILLAVLLTGGGAEQEAVRVPKQPVVEIPTFTLPVEGGEDVPDTVVIAGQTISTDVTELDLSEKELTDHDIVSLRYMTNLTDLDLESNQISDVSVLSGLTNLTTLNLEHNQISDISPLAGLRNLTWLSLWDNEISDVSALSGLTDLAHLSLWDNQISDVRPLSGLTLLTYLDLDRNQISDVSPLAGLTKLRLLYMKYNQISDVSALSVLTNLSKMELEDNQLEQAQIDAIKAALPDCAFVF